MNTLDIRENMTYYEVRKNNTRIIAEALLSGKAEYKNSKEIILKERNLNKELENGNHKKVFKAAQNLQEWA